MRRCAICQNNGDLLRHIKYKDKIFTFCFNHPIQQIQEFFSGSDKNVCRDCLAITKLRSSGKCSKCELKKIREQKAKTRYVQIFDEEDNVQNLNKGRITISFGGYKTAFYADGYTEELALYAKKEKERLIKDLIRNPKKYL